MALLCIHGSGSSLPVANFSQYGYYRQYWKYREVIQAFSLIQDQFHNWSISDPRLWKWSSDSKRLEHSLPLSKCLATMVNDCRGIQVIQPTMTPNRNFSLKYSHNTSIFSVCPITQTQRRTFRYCIFVGSFLEYRKCSVAFDIKECD
jgi:hypothetical protein